MPIYLLENEVSTMTPKAFTEGIISNVTSTVSLADVAGIVGVIIVAGLGSVVAWKFGRKAYNFIKNAIMGKGARF